MRGDGLADEGLVLYDDGTDVVTVAGDVTRLEFDAAPNGLTFRLDLAAVSEEGELITRSYVEQISFRNP